MSQSKKQSFEESIKELEKIVHQLEEEEAKDLDSAIGLFKKGMELSKICSDKLEHAEKQIYTILGEGENAELQPINEKDLDID